MTRGVSALPTLCPGADLLLSSPFTRAVQTAEYVAKAYGLEIDTTDTLEPERPPADVVRVLKTHDADVAIIVGHEPHLGILASWLIAGTTDTHVELKKGAACLIRFEGQPAKGAGMLRWLLDARMLRAIAG